MSSFDEAVAGTRPAQGEEVAETFYEKREYPVVPPGKYNAMIVNAQLRESKSTMDPPGTTKINLRLEILSDATTGKVLEYKGDDDKPHRYQVFSRPLAKNYGDGAKTGKPSNLFKLVKELTGIPPLTDEEQAERTIEGGRKIKGTVIRYNFKMLEYMECQVFIEHKEWQGRMTPEIITYVCTPEQRQKNFESLPPHPKKPTMGGPVRQAFRRPQEPATAEDASEVFRPEKGASLGTAPGGLRKGIDYGVLGSDTEATMPPPLRTPEQEQMLAKEMTEKGFPL